MKKIFYILSTALLALAACNKEADFQKQNDITPGATKTGYVLHASISDLATKAEIAEATGAVTFNENDSFIIQGDDGNWYTFTTSQSGASVDFVCPDAPSTVSFVGKEANYPADKFSTTSNSFNMPAEYASPKDALKNGIFMSGKVSSEGTLLFSHTLAGMLKVTFNNVPEFADNVYFEKGTAPLLKTEVSLAGKSGDNVVVYCPIYYLAGDLTVSLRDADDNVILQKSTTVPSGQQGKLYALKPLTVNNYIVFKNSSISTHAIGVMSRTDTGDGLYTGWGTDWGQYPLVALSSGDKYYILDDKYQSATILQIEIRYTDSDATASKAEWVYNRNIVFDVSDNSLKTSYRVYPFSSTVNSVDMESLNTDYIIGEIQNYNQIYFFDNPAMNNDWPGYAMSQLSDGRYYYRYNNDNAFKMILNDGSNQTSDLSIPALSGYYTVFVNKDSQIFPEKNPDAESCSYQGALSPGISSEIYIEIPAALYGKIYSIKANGSSFIWTDIINRDYPVIVQ